MQEFNIKVGDRLPVLVATILDGDGAAVNLSTATTVAFRMRTQGGSGAALFTTNCVITDATNGVVEYRWAAGNTSAAGTYDGEFVVTWNDGRIQTVPNGGFVRVKVAATLT